VAIAMFQQAAYHFPQALVRQLTKDRVRPIRVESLIHISEHAPALFGAPNGRVEAVPEGKVARQPPSQDLPARH
jgi:hypothetical protein